MDIIRVETEEKMLEVCNWFDDNKEWLDTFKFKPVFLDGKIIFEYEETYLKFTCKNNIYYLTFGASNIDIYKFEYYIAEDKLTSARVIGDLSKERRKYLLIINQSAQICQKAFTKFYMITEFANHYRKYIVSETKKEKKSNIKSNKNTSTYKEKESKIGITYYISKVPKTVDGKRAYTIPDHEVSCKGTYRHYKSGKVIWVEPFTRYKGKGKNENDKLYKL